MGVLGGSSNAVLVVIQPSVIGYLKKTNKYYSDNFTETVNIEIEEKKTKKLEKSR